MKKASTQLLNDVAGILNAHVDNNDETAALLSADPPVALELINEILRTTAEGSRLVVARETDGTLVGFVPRRNVPTLDPSTVETSIPLPPISPEDE